MEYNDKAIERHIARAKHLQERAEKRYNRIMIFGMAVAIAIIATLLVGGKADREYTETTVIVKTGDTLWSVAELYCPNDMDKRKYIYAMQEDNDCTANIHPGDVLVVRVYEEN